MVAEGPSVQGVHGMELLDVDHDGVHGRLRVLPEHAVGILEEIIPVVQPCQLVGLRGGDQGLRPFLRPDAPEQQGQDQKHHRSDHGGKQALVVPDHVGQGFRGVLRDVVGKRRVDGGIGDQADDLCHDGIQLRLPGAHRKAEIQVLPGGEGAKVILLADP